MVWRIVDQELLVKFVLPEHIGFASVGRITRDKTCLLKFCPYLRDPLCHWWIVISLILLYSCLVAYIKSVCPIHEKHRILLSPGHHRVHSEKLQVLSCFEEFSY